MSKKNKDKSVEEPQIEDTSPPAKETPAENPESENPFLAIRQAVISAGDADSDAGCSSEDKKTDNAAASQKDSSIWGTGENISGHRSSAKVPSDRSFTDQIAQLIDNEIEVRLKTQLSIFALADHLAKAATRGEEKSKKNPIAKKTAKKRASASKKTQATKTQAPKKQVTKTQIKSLEAAAARAANGAKKVPLKKTTASKAVTRKKTRANKKIVSLKKNAPAKKKS